MTHHKQATRRSMKRRGFTLVELAIVLAVAGLLLLGLWRLMSAGNQQITASSAASQQLQLINATKAFLASNNGQLWMAAKGPSVAYNLPLPSFQPDGQANTTCKANTSGGAASNLASYCDYLPVGFYSGTQNAYGQAFTVQVRNDAIAASPSTPPRTYSFMIVTTGTTKVPDTVGGSIANQIGGDGGFIYNNPAGVCTAGASYIVSCGAYGAWTQQITGASNYGFATPASGGFVATRTFISPESDASLPWLARILISGDTTVPPTYNTMQTDAFLGGKTLWMGKGGTLPNTGGTLDVQNGTINLDGGTISGSGTSHIVISGDGGVNNGIRVSVPTGAVNSAMYVSTGCNKTSPNDNSCVWGMQVIGDGTFSNLLNANALYAGTFIYQSSDIRLKRDIKPLHDPLDDIMRLNPVSFTYKSNGKPSLGVIAQELEKVYPQLISQNGDGMKAVSYEGLIAPLIGSVQQLKKENDELRAELKVQAKRQRELEDRMDAKTGTP